MNTALFSFKKEALTQSTYLPGKEELFKKLTERSIRPIVSLNAETAFDENGVEAHELQSENTTRSIGHVGIESVGVIVNRLDRSFKKDQIPDAWNEAARPVMNENALRSLVFRKARTHDELLKPLGLGIPTQLIENPMDAALFVAENHSEQYIVKPNSGTNSQGVLSLTGEQAIALFASEMPEKQMVMQPKYDFTRPFDSSVKPYDTLSNEAFDGWSKSDVVKEFRMYAFYSPSFLNMFPAVRAMQDGVDQWFFVDPSSLPEKIYSDTRRTISKAAEMTGSRAIYAALDFGYGSANADEQPDYHVVELNGRMPYLIGYDKHPQVADTLREHKANQIADTITSQLT